MDYNKKVLRVATSCISSWRRQLLGHSGAKRITRRHNCLSSVSRIKSGGAAHQFAWLVTLVAKSSRVFAFLDALPRCINKRERYAERDRVGERERERRGRMWNREGDFIDVPGRDVLQQQSDCIPISRLYSCIAPFAYMSRRSHEWAWQMAVSAALLRVLSAQNFSCEEAWTFFCFNRQKCRKFLISLKCVQ